MFQPDHQRIPSVYVLCAHQSRKSFQILSHFFLSPLQKGNRSEHTRIGPRYSTHILHYSGTYAVKKCWGIGFSSNRFTKIWRICTSVLCNTELPKIRRGFAFIRIRNVLLHSFPNLMRWTWPIYRKVASVEFHVWAEGVNLLLLLSQRVADKVT